MSILLDKGRPGPEAVVGPPAPGAGGVAGIRPRCPPCYRTSGGLHAPDLLPGVPEAAERILGAVGRGRRVCVYGDYDVDGVTGTAILLRGLHLLNAQVDWHVPHRLEEGYGLNREALRKIAAEGADLVVTVDCGITSVA